MTTDTRPMPEKQRQILAYVKQFIREHSYPPTVREIATGCNIASASTVTYHLTRLENSGHIARNPDIARSITVYQQLSEDEVKFGRQVATDLLAEARRDAADQREISEVNADYFDLADGALNEVRMLAEKWQDGYGDALYGCACQLEAILERYDKLVKEKTV